MSQAKIQLLIDQGTHLNNTSSNTDISRMILEEINRNARVFDNTNVLKLIIDKVRTFNEKVALQALNILEYIVERSPTNFEIEVGRNRFLNEFARLLSPKHDADACPTPIKERITLILASWVKLFPRQSKIATAYKALKSKDYLIKGHIPGKGGKEEVLGDERSNRKLNILLRSTNPSDLVLANRLIKSMVRREERRSINIFTRKQKIDNASENILLLKDLIESIRKGTDVDFSTVNEIKLTCDDFYKSLNLTAGKALDDNDPFLNDLINISDNYISVLQDFEECKKMMGVSATTQVSSAPRSTPNSKNTANLVDLMDLDFTTTTPVTSSQNTMLDAAPTKTSSVNDQKSLLDDDFLDVFSSGPAPTAVSNPTTTPSYSSIPNNFQMSMAPNPVTTSAASTFSIHPQAQQTTNAYSGHGIQPSQNTQMFGSNYGQTPMFMTNSSATPQFMTQTTGSTANYPSTYGHAQTPVQSMDSMFSDLNLQATTQSNYVDTVDVGLNDITIVKTEAINSPHFTVYLAKGSIKPEFVSKLDTNKAQIYLLTIMNMSPSSYGNFKISISSTEGSIKTFAPSTAALSAYSPITPPSTLNVQFVTERTVSNITIGMQFDKDSKAVQESYPFQLIRLSQ